MSEYTKPGPSLDQIRDRVENGAFDIQEYEPTFAPPRILWSLGSDEISAEMCQLNIDPTTLDIILRICRRDKNVRKEISNVEGRRATFLCQPISTLQGPYNALEISGFGYSPMTEIASGLTARNKFAKIALPRAENYAESHPHTSTTARVVNGNVTTTSSEYSFTGAYTRAQALEKVVNSLYIYKSLRSDAQAPSLPIPLAIGDYPSITSPEDPSQTAHFVAFLVPYSGERDAVVKPGSATKMVNQAKRVGKTIRKFHDATGMGHYQLHAGNMFIPKAERGPIYLADFSTARVLDSQSEIKGRTLDLQGFFSSLERIIIASRLPLPMKQQAYKNLMEGYLGGNPKLPVLSRSAELRDVIEKTLRIGIPENRFQSVDRQQQLTGRLAFITDKISEEINRNCA